MEGVTIPLTKGLVAIVDREDYDWLSGWSWYAHKKNSDYTFYARRAEWKNGKRITIFMHREILGLAKNDGKITDHINRNGLDNRKDNLRVVNHSVNRTNSKILSNNSSGYRGVDWQKKAKRWRARISINGRRINIGTFKSSVSAAMAYDKEAKKIGVALNFPQGENNVQ